MTRGLGDDFELDDFFFDFSEDFGFGKIFKRIGVKNGFTEFLIEVPRIYKDDTEYRKLMAISGSFAALTNFLPYCTEVTKSPHNQLLIFETNMRLHRLGYSVWGEVSATMTDWLLSLQTEKGRIYLPEVEKAMLSAFRIMHDNPDAENRDLRAHVTEGGFIIDCHGEACGLNPVEFLDIKKGESYDFSCHNVDDPIQQFLLLIGLSALWKKAKEEIEATL